MTEGPRPPAVAVLDVARETLRLVAVSPERRILTSRVAPNVTRSAEPYPYLDVEHLWRWLTAALADFGERFDVQAIVPVAGSTGVALVDEAGELVLPIPDPASAIPATVATGYAEVAPWFEECRAPVAPAAWTLARQIYWLSKVYDAAAARARWILPLPQYLAFGLCGVAAAEVSALGAQTQLWNPDRGTLTSLAAHEGWADRLPPRRAASEVLGPLRRDLAERAELPPGVPVLCGVDREAARRLRPSGAGPATLVSSGEWITVHARDWPVPELDPLRDTAAVVDPDGSIVASARFLAGAEARAIRGSRAGDEVPELADLEALVAAGTMAVPAFARSGPFPVRAGKGRIRGPRPSGPRARGALVELYLALMTDAMLGLVGGGARLVIDGPAADARLFGPVLAALRPQREVLVIPEGDGAALGASLLWQADGAVAANAPAPVPLAPLGVEGLTAYAGRWREAAARAPRLNLGRVLSAGALSSG